MAKSHRREALVQSFSVGLSFDGGGRMKRKIFAVLVLVALLLASGPARGAGAPDIHVA